MIRKQAIVFLALFHLAANAEIYSSVVADVTDGLIGHWKLDEMSYNGTAGEVVDSSGNGNHGFTLGLPKTNPGVNGRSLVIDSRWGIYKNPMAVIPHTDSLTLSGDFTVCLWVYPLHNGSSLIAKRTNAAGSEFDIALSASSGYIVVYSAGVFRGFATPNLLNKWSYLTVCRSNTCFSVSVNGVNYGTTDSVFTPLGCPAEIGIGAVRYVPTGRYGATSGNYDDVRLYNRALTGDEIKKLYVFTQKQRESYASVSSDIPYENLPTNGLIAHWKLDEISYNGTAGEVKDSSGNGNNGTAFGKVITNPSNLGRCVFLNGESFNYINGGIIEDVSSLGNSLTVTARIRPHKIWSLHGIVSNRNKIGVNDGWVFGLNSGGVAVYSKSWYASHLCSVSAFKDYFVSFTHSDGQGVIYIDGTAKYSFPVTLDAGQGPVSIGSWDNGRWVFDGAIDDVRIYNRALSPEEIAQIYKARPVKEGIVAVYSGNKLISNPEKKDYPNTVSENIEPVTLTFEYVSTYPSTITIGGTGYGQPADPSKALVDAGDGVFVQWTSNTIAVKGKRIRFRGDWRNSTGNLRELFRGTFGGGHNVTMSGGFDFDGAPAADMFRSTFYNCSNLTGSIPVGLFGNISGAPAVYMFGYTFSGCSNLTGSIPVGLFGNISGAPAPFMFSGTFSSCSKLTDSIPSGLFGNISGAPAGYMFYYTFAYCSNLTGSIPSDLFGNISGTPQTYMFNATFQNCSKLTGESALMPDGTTHLYEQFPTASGTQCDNCFYGATGLDDYATMPAAWK